MKYCIYCGNSIKDEDIFCTTCGNKQETDVSPVNLGDQPGQGVMNGQPGQGMMNGQPMPGMMNDQPMPGMMNGQPTAGMMNGQPTQGMMNGQPTQGMMNDQQMPGMMNGQPTQGMTNGQQMSGMMNGQPTQGMMNGQQMSGMMNGQPTQGMMNGQPMSGMMNGQPTQGMMNGQPMFGMMNGQQAAGMMNGQQMAGMMGGQQTSGMIGGQQAGGVTGGSSNTSGKKKKKKMSGRKKAAIIISSVAAVLIIACVVVYFLGFRKPTKKYLTDYFTGPDPNYENFAGEPEYYHFWYYIGGITGENGVYCKVTNVDIVKSEFKFFKGSARVALTVDDEYMTRIIHADLKLSGVAGSWKIDSVTAEFDDPDNKIVKLKEDFVKRMVSSKILGNGKYGLDEYEKDRLIAFNTEELNNFKSYEIKYDVSNVNDNHEFDGYVTVKGYIDIDPEWSDTDYRTNPEVDASHVSETDTSAVSSANNSTGSNDTGNNNNTGNNNGNSTGTVSGNTAGNDNGSSNISGNSAGGGIAENNNNPVQGLPAITGEKIYIYSWNEELGDLLKKFYEKYPEYRELVDYTALGMNSTDQEYFDTVYAKMNDPLKPLSMVVYDGEYSNPLNDSRFASLNGLGLDSYYKNAYDYTVREATFDGVLKGMSPYVCPSGFYYRKDIAEDVLGTSDPDEVRKRVGTWGAFEDTAALMKSSGYYMLCTPGDLYRGYGGSTWDGNVPSEGLSMAERFVNNGYFYFNEDQMWGTVWNEGMSANVFGYFGPNWLSTTISGYSNNEWGFCPGPEYHHWGGAYIGIAESCPNKGLAALILYTICCDEDIQYSYALMDSYWYVPNNKKVAEKLIQTGDICYNSSVIKNPVAEYNDEIAENTH